jgi:hypothetical protein
VFFRFLLPKILKMIGREIESRFGKHRHVCT